MLEHKILILLLFLNKIRMKWLNDLEFEATIILTLKTFLTEFLIYIMAQSRLYYS